MRNYIIFSPTGTIPFFANVQKLELLSDLFSFREYQTNEIIFDQGDVAGELCFPKKMLFLFLYHENIYILVTALTYIHCFHGILFSSTFLDNTDAFYLIIRGKCTVRVKLFSNLCCFFQSLFFSLYHKIEIFILYTCQSYLTYNTCFLFSFHGTLRCAQQKLPQQDTDQTQPHPPLPTLRHVVVSIIDQEQQVLLVASLQHQQQGRKLALRI